MVTPSKRALERIKAEVKNQTRRGTHSLPTPDVIRRLNQTVRGWVGYYYYGNCSKALTTLKWYLEERVRTYLMRKHRKSRGYAFMHYSSRYLYEELGLYKVPITAPWTQAAKASGRR